MGKVVIRCAKCNNDEWIKSENPNPKEKHLDDWHKKCSNCGAIYCAKNRKWCWED